MFLRKHVWSTDYDKSVWIYSIATKKDVYIYKDICLLYMYLYIYISQNRIATFLRKLLRCRIEG